MLLWIDTIVDAYQKSWHQMVIMVTDLANSSAHVDDSKNLRNAHIINKSYIVNRTSYIATAFSNAVALCQTLLPRLESAAQDNVARRHDE